MARGYMVDALPILYSFRRCPYAMRARLAIAAAGVQCELREVLLRDKAPEFLETSPKATVPVVVMPDGQVIDQSLDVMLWALAQNDPAEWLIAPQGKLADMLDLIAQADGDFKTNLDHYKYVSRDPDSDGTTARDAASVFLHALNSRLSQHSFLFGDRTALSDMAIAPFVRQLAAVDQVWFDSQPWIHLKRWLAMFLASSEFAAVMTKYKKWQAGDPVTLFPESL
ncbi:MAG: glutathione S-transferase [Rhodobacterales bacterium]|jgi:glutathione S-transferase